MNTTGKAVDSVIQYQLHRETGNSETNNLLVLNNNKIYEGHTVTQDEIDSYKIDSNNHPLSTNTIYDVYEYDLTPEQLVNNPLLPIIFIDLNDGNHVQISNYEFYDDYGEEEDIYALMNITTVIGYTAINKGKFRFYYDLQIIG